MSHLYLCAVMVSQLFSSKQLSNNDVLIFQKFQLTHSFLTVFRVALIKSLSCSVKADALSLEGMKGRMKYRSNQIGNRLTFNSIFY